MSATYRPVAGRCPSCDHRALFLGDGGHVTCSWVRCPDRSAPDTLLHTWRTVFLDLLARADGADVPAESAVRERLAVEFDRLSDEAAAAPVHGRLGDRDYTDGMARAFEQAARIARGGAQ